MLLDPGMREQPRRDFVGWQHVEMTLERRELYARYLDACNRHDFGKLDEFVAADVLVNGSSRGLQAYVEGLWGVVAEFPDYTWELLHVLIEDDWLAAHFHDRGARRDGTAVWRQEFAFYRYERDLIVEVWVGATD